MKYAIAFFFWSLCWLTLARLHGLWYGLLAWPAVSSAVVGWAYVRRDPAVLGIMSVDNDALYLPLRKGSNELVLAVSELGGGWGFACRLADVGH